ncbi:hypothetical protein [Pseudomonas sp. zfem005]|uniref:hypothetical protein n=1 Tax=Pseudomonas sp. zfem005 TaxID=3078200 RepID=UPI00292A241B|nr:hypothetical protein [Pseudomonas sp. zfem005]MDU9413372.1 hypothetical protein [Pseudomonas sp. zfem005]
MDFKLLITLPALLGLASGLAAQERQRLETVAPDATTAFELSLPACTQAPCPFELRLLRGGQPVGAPAVLAWSATAAPAQPAESDPLYGTGTPLASASAQPGVWITGEEEGQVSASARPLPLADGAQALLVTQMAGFEHPKRRHALYLATAQGPRLAWSHDETPGPNQSWVLAATGESPVLLVRYHATEDNAPDRLETRNLKWNGDHSALAEAATPPPASLLAVIAERHASATAAHASRTRQPECLGSYAVIDTGTPGANRYALMQVAESASQAQAETTRLGHCAETLRPQTVPLAPLLNTPAPTP